MGPLDSRLQYKTSCHPLPILCKTATLHAVPAKLGLPLLRTIHTTRGTEKIWKASNTIEQKRGFRNNIFVVETILIDIKHFHQVHISATKQGEKGMNHSNENFALKEQTKRAARQIADLASNMRNIPTGGDAVDLGPTFQPGAFDVICSRGKKAFEHAGNRNFRNIIERHMKEYATASTKFEKSIIVTQIVDQVRQASPGGGFIRRDNGRWYEVGDAVAREKVGQRYVHARGILSFACYLRVHVADIWCFKNVFLLPLVCPVSAINFI